MVPAPAGLEVDTGAVPSNLIDRVSKCLDRRLAPAGEIENFTWRRRRLHGGDDTGNSVADEIEVARLLAAPRDRQRLARHGKLQEIRDHVAVAARMLARP